MPDISSRTTTVYQPSISDFSPDANQIYTPREEQPTKLLQLFTVMAGTGQLPRLGLPENLQNISYIVDLVVPIVRCRISDETERTRTTDAAYKEAISGFPDLAFQANFNAQDLSFVGKGEDVGFSIGPGTARIGYYATVVFDLSKPYDIDTLSIAIANVGNDSISHSVDFYTCAIRNASITANVTFSNSIQSVRTTKVQEVDLVKDFETSVPGNANAPLYAFERTTSFLHPNSTTNFLVS